MFRKWLGRFALVGAVVTGVYGLTLVGAWLFLALDTTGRDSRAAAGASPAAPERSLVSTAGRILFIAQYQGTDDFYVVNVDGSGLTRLTHLREGSIFSRPGIVSPDRTRLALSTGPNEISMLRLDRPGETSRLDRPAGWLAWSPDGKQLASLTIDQGKRLHLHLFNADSSGGVRDIAQSWPSTAVGDEQYVGDLVWSPDASRFAFVLRTRPHHRRSGPKHSHLYIAHADGSVLENLSLAAGGLQVSGGLSWSPDGRRLAFRGGEGIGSVDLDLDWSEIAVWPHSTRADQHPSWSPDGAWLAWFDPQSIVVSDPDGQHPSQLTKGRCPGVQPAWSEDGRRIAFLCEDPRHFTNVFAMNADGSGLRQVTHLGEGESGINANAHYSPKFPLWLPPLPSD